METHDIVRSYTAVPTALKFHYSSAKVKGIMGPYGSGKSSACVMDIFMRAMAQRPHNGIRKTSWAIFRNSYPELQSTTLKTWKYWVPEFTPQGKPYCEINYQKPITAKLHDMLPDGTKLEMEVIFLAMDRPEDVGKINSLEITGAWINEGRFFPLEVLSDIIARTNRFPAKAEGGNAWSGVLIDTNPPEVDSLYYNYAEIIRPPSWEFFRQPPAILKIPNRTPDEYVPNMGQDPHYGPCENAENHTAGYNYWMDQLGGADSEWIKVHLMGEYGTVKIGKPVYEHQYRDSFHCAAKNLEVYRGLPLILGQDWGRSPGTVICQLSPKGQLRILDEIYADNMSAHQFGRDFLLPYLRSEYAGLPYRVIADPAGTQKAQSNETSCLIEFQELNIPIEMARSNLLDPRLGAVRKLLLSNVGGEPRLIISPKAKMLRRGFQKSYFYREIKTSTGKTHSYEPEKNHPFSTLHDGTQYVCMDVEMPTPMLSRPSEAYASQVDGYRSGPPADWTPYT